MRKGNSIVLLILYHKNQIFQQRFAETGGFSSFFYFLYNHMLKQLCTNHNKKTLALRKSIRLREIYQYVRKISLPLLTV